MFPKNWKWHHLVWIWGIIFLCLVFLCFLFIGIHYVFFSSLSFILFLIFLGATFWYFFSNFYISFHQWLSSKGLLSQDKFVHPKDMLNKLDIVSQNIETLRGQCSQNEKECQKLRLEKEQLEKKCREAYKQSEISRLLFHQTLNSMEYGIGFISEDGNLLPHYSPAMVSILEENELAGRSIISLLFPWQPDLKKMEIFKRWLNTVLESDLKDWKENPIPFKSLLWKKDIRGKMVSKNLKIHFAPVIQDNIVINVIVFLQEIQQEKLAQEESKSESNHPTLEYAMEILKAEPSLRQDFFTHLESQIQAFQEKQALLQQGTLNRLVILELSNCIKEIKSSARVVKFRSIIQEAEKLETLLNILRTGQKMFRMEQLLEIEERTRNFIETLHQYNSMGKQIQ